MNKRKILIIITEKIIKILIINLIIIIAIRFSFANEYNRKNWKHWTDEDKNCLNTRHELLKSTSLVKVVLNKKGCIVLNGSWFDPYSGKYYTNSRRLDIDHIVPLKEAYLSGGSKWTKKQKEVFANDIDNLIPVLARENRQKGAKDFAKWLPSNENYVCKYIESFVSIKKKYKLILDVEEIQFLMDGDCSFVFIN